MQSELVFFLVPSDAFVSLGGCQVTQVDCFFVLVCLSHCSGSELIFLVHLDTLHCLGVPLQLLGDATAVAPCHTGWFLLLLLLFAWAAVAIPHLPCQLHNELIFFPVHLDALELLGGCHCGCAIPHRLIVVLFFVCSCSLEPLQWHFLSAAHKHFKHYCYCVTWGAPYHLGFFHFFLLPWHHHTQVDCCCCCFCFCISKAMVTQADCWFFIMLHSEQQ